MNSSLSRTAGEGRGEGGYRRFGFQVPTDADLRAPAPSPPTCALFDAAFGTLFGAADRCDPCPPELRSL